MKTEPQRVNAGPHVVSYSVRVNAAPEEIYALVANPHRHHEVDGSHTVQSRASGPDELTQDARFSVNMKKLGIPYRLPLRVTQAQRHRIIEWRQPTGHRWRWEFSPTDSGGTQVTESYDASRQNRFLRTILESAGILPKNGQSIHESLNRVLDLFNDPQHP